MEMTVTPPRKRWLTGWRRLWIVWAVVSLLLVLVILAKQDSLRSESKFLFDEDMGVRQAAYDRAYERIAGEKLGTPPRVEFNAKTGKYDIDNSTATRALRQLVAGGDDQLRAEIQKIEAEYRPKIDAAYDRERQTFWILVAICWSLLCGGSYALGSVVAWIRRGFQRDEPDHQPV